VAEREGFDGSYAGDFWDVTNRQDWAACESVQRSAASRGFRPGPISELEESVFQFFNMIAAGYVDGHIGHPRNPTILVKPKR
jgi:Rieske 2Fe-2S family protein